MQGHLDWRQGSDHPVDCLHCELHDEGPASQGQIQTAVHKARKKQTEKLLDQSLLMH